MRPASLAAQETARTLSAYAPPAAKIAIYDEILRACACAAMEMPTEALADRQAVIAQSENYRETAKAERAFALLHGNDTFEKLVNPMELAT